MGNHILNLTYARRLARLPMGGMLSAKAAILFHFQPVGIVLFIFHTVIIALLAFGAGHGNFHAHLGHLLKIICGGLSARRTCLVNIS